MHVCFVTDVLEDTQVFRTMDRHVYLYCVYRYVRLLLIFLNSFFSDRLWFPPPTHLLLDNIKQEQKSIILMCVSSLLAELLLHQPCDGLK